MNTEGSGAIHQLDAGSFHQRRPSSEEQARVDRLMRAEVTQRIDELEERWRERAIVPFLKRASSVERTRRPLLNRHPGLPRFEETRFSPPPVRISRCYGFDWSRPDSPPSGFPRGVRTYIPPTFQTGTRRHLQFCVRLLGRGGCLIRHWRGLRSARLRTSR